MFSYSKNTLYLRVFHYNYFCRYKCSLKRTQNALGKDKEDYRVRFKLQFYEFDVNHAVVKVKLLIGHLNCI